MKKIILILVTVLLVFGVSACKDITTQKETESISSDNVASVDLEELINTKEIIDAEELINSEELINIGELIKEIKYDKVSSYMENECRKAFSPYYELLDFQVSDYHEKVVDGNDVEVTFSYKLIHKNYDRDPDTVEYIKEAKESGNKNYQQMYDEYLQPKEMNFHLKAIINENGEITLYSNISPNGIEWEETKMTDFIIK